MSTFSVPYTFVNGTVADGTQVNANFSAIVAAGNNINASNIGALGIYATNIIPTTITQGTFGGTQPYTFNNGIIATPTSSTPTATTGTVWYDQTQDSLSYFNSTGFETNIGQQVDQVVYNGTGSTLNPGQAVYISGAGSGAYTAYAAVSLAVATSTSTANAIGVVGQTIANGSVGMVVILGRITNVNTTAWTSGQTLYLDYSTAGQLITTQPTSPYYAVRIGFVIIGGSSSGSIFVSVRNVYTLGSNIISPVIFTAFSNTSTPLTLNGVSGQIAPLFNVNTLASGGTNVFQIAASGAASFSNTVTVGSLTFGGSGGGAWSVLSNQVALTPGTSQTSGGYIANAANTSKIISWDNTGNLTSLGSFNTGSSTYGPTYASVNGSVVANASVIASAGTGSYTAPTVGTANGDIIAQRSTSTGQISLGGSSNSGSLNYGITNSGQFTFSGGNINGNGNSFITGSSTYGPTSATVNGNITASGVVTFQVSSSSGNLIINSGNSSASVVALNYNNGATGGFAVGDGSTGYYGTITSTGLHAGSSNYGLTSASVAGSITPGYSSAVGTSSIYSGTGTPAFSAPSGSLYLSYSGTGGGLVYYNSSTAGTSGTSWAAFGASVQEQYAVFTASTTWTCPAGVTKVYAFVVGAGGGGDGLDNTGGGSGGQAYGYYTVSPGTGYTITVGTAGTGSTSGSGTSGNTSSFASFCSATGGGAGTSGGGGSNGSGSSGNLRNNTVGTSLQSTFAQFTGLNIYGAASRITTSATVWSTTLSDSTSGASQLVQPGASGSIYGNGGVGGVVALWWVG